MTTPATADFVGLADMIYNRTNLTTGSLPFQINNTKYQVLDAINNGSSDGFYGVVLLDQSTKAVFVVDRGTDPKNWQDLLTDIVMPFTNDNLQWQDANNLAQFAKQYAATNGSIVYTVGHSLGGTLAQMQAAINGWNSVTFNAYGAGEVLTALGYNVATYQPNITNYRTLFDLVSNASTQIGNVVTLETPQDSAFLTSWHLVPQLDLLETVGSDHGISNFYSQGSDPTGSNPKDNGVPTYVAAGMFAFPAPTNITIAMAQDIVNGLGTVLSNVREISAEINNTIGPAATASAILGWISGKYTSGETADIGPDYYLLKNALNPSAAYNIYRASLAAGSPVLVDGLDPNEVQADTLWSPGQTSGLTQDYLIARNAMVQASITLAGESDSAGSTITTNDSNTYVYTDLKQSSTPLYTLIGKGDAIYDIEFGDDKGDLLQGSPEAHAELFGGAGNDTLMGGPVSSTLEGGAGNDLYVIDGSGTGTDQILDTDGQGTIEWQFAGGGSEDLSGGDNEAGTPYWKSADGKFTYFEDVAADGSTELVIEGSGKTVDVDNFTNGEFGITLNNGSATTPGPGDLSNFSSTTYSDHTEYQDLSGTGGGDSMEGVNTTGGNYNVLEGEGNAGYIYAGDGNNDVFVNDLRYSPVGEVFSNPLSVMIQGGTGDQLLVGMGDDGSHGNGKETIVGGAMGTDTTAWTTIDGGGTYVNALLAGGSQNSMIFGGLGTDTIMASSAVSGSGKPDPTTIATAGLSFWASSSQGTSGSETVTGEPEVSIPTFSNPANFQIDVALNQLDGSYAAPFGLLGSQWDTGTDTSPWKDSSGAPITLPGSLIIGGSGEDFLIGNSGNDTLVGGTPAHPAAGVVDEVLVGGGGANVIYGGGGTELIFADLSAGGDANWANLDPSDADTIYGGTGNEYIYGSGGNDVIYGGSGNYTIYTGNGNAYVEAGSGNTIVNGGNGSDTIIAGSGADSIATGDGNSYVEVQGGQSTIATGAGSDTIEAAGGDALITEGTGATTILAGTGAGSDTVQSGSGSTTVQLQDGLTESTLIARDVNGDLVLSDEDSDTQITFTGYFKNGGNVSVQFQDGTTWGASQILAASIAPRTDGGNDTLIGSNGNDSLTAGYGDTSIVGVSGNNTLTGGAGDDTIQGGSGADTIEGGSGTTQIVGGTGSETYMFNVGDGSDTITENTSSPGTDVLKFGTGITSSNATFALDAAKDLVISFAGTTNSTLTVTGFMATGDSLHQIGTFQFADGTSLTRQQVIQSLVAVDGTTGNDNLNGTSGADYFDGKGGNDVENGNGGNDTFVFNSGYGQLTINESYTSGQAPVLQLGTGITASALVVTTGGSNSLYLADGVSGDQIVLENEESLPGSSGVAEVQFADGTTLSAAQLVQMSHELSGTTGNDTLWGTIGADHFDGKGGSDEEIGLGGDDTFVFNPGYGALEIDETYSSGQQPILQLGDGITLSTLHVTEISQGYYSGLNVGIELTDGVAGDEVTLDNMISYANYGLQGLRFADGTTLTRDQLLRMATTGTSGNDEIYGTSGADYFDGKGSDSLSGSEQDEEVGNGGSDTFVFDPGYGNLFIDETYSSGQQPVLQLGAGITQASLHVAVDSSGNFIVTDGVVGDKVTLSGFLGNQYSGVAEVAFSDGTTLTRDQLINLETSGGTSGNDTLQGASESDYFDGKGGNDSEIGGGGSDTFAFNPGYGSLVISEEYATGEQPVLQLGAGITSTSLHVSGNGGGGIVLTDGIAGDQITLGGELTGGPTSGYQYGVQEVEFADGTTLSRAQLVQMETTGTSGDDTLYGTSGADYFDGKGGNDVEYGDGGSDTFVFNPGYGQLEIQESYSEANPPVPQSPIVQLGAGITLSDLRVKSDGRNLEVTDGTSGDQIKIDDGLWDTPATPGLPIVKLFDGTTLSMEQLVQMGTSQGTPGSDSLYGSGGNELFDGKGGNDYESGGGGNDTFVFNSGYGKLAIYDPGINGGSSVLEMGSGIDSASLSVAENVMGDFVITDGVAGDQITIQSPRFRGYPSSSSNVQTVQFADGSTLTQSQLIQMVSNLAGTTGSDYLVGTAGADYFDGKGGDDYEMGNGGADTFVFNQGYGALEVGEEYGYTLELGPGITSSNLKFFEDGSDLILTDGTYGDFIRLDGAYMDNMASPSASGVEFSDGTTLSFFQMANEAYDNYWTYNGPEYYRLGAESGNGSVSEGSGAISFNILYADGITSTDVTVRADASDDLILTNKSTGSQFVVENYFRGYQNVTVNFADNVTWQEPQLLQTSMTPDDGDDYLYGSNGNDTITGGPGNDTIVGVSGGNVLTGGTGNSTIYGGSGADIIEGGSGTNQILGGTGWETYVFNVGDGSDTITENASPPAPSGNDVLKLGGSILTSDATFTHASGSEDLEIQFGSESGASITISNFFAAATGGHQVGSFVFADGTTLSAGHVSTELTAGTTLTAAQLLRMATTGTPGNDTLYGEPEADLFDGKGGNDLEIGEGGNDTFVFNSGYGQLEINESYTSGQQPVLQLGVGITASALHMTSDGTNLMLTDGVSGDQITLDGMWSTPGDGIAAVQFADGTTLAASQLIQMEMTGTSGNDSIYGTSGADLLDGKGGNDSVTGNGGDDTFVFNSGYGDLEINESYTSGQQPELQLGTGITASALRVTASGNNLVLTDGVSGDQITLDNEASTSGDGVAIVQLSDGTTLTATQLIQMSHDIYGTTGNDTLTGTSGAELIDGEGGNDSITGKGGSDTFVFDSGYGQLTINESYKSGQQPVLQLGAGITAAALRVTKSGNNIVLADGVSGDQITLYDMWSSSSYGVATAQLADGTTLTRSQLIQMEMTGTPGNDTLYGTSGDDLIDGKGGNDSVVGSGGNDTFVFDSGYGHLTVNETYTSGQQPELQLGAGITTSTLRVTKSGNNLVLTDGVSGDQVTLINMWSNSSDGVASAKLADGTTLTRSQLIQMEMTGTTGNDTLYGTSGADLLDGKGGSDSVVGGGGNDTFVFDSGYGHLTINETYTTSQQPLVQFGAGIASSTVTVAVSGSNLVLKDGVTGDQITLINMATSSTNGVALVKFADGTTLTRSQLIGMEPAAVSATLASMGVGPSMQTAPKDGAPGTDGRVARGLMPAMQAHDMPMSAMSSAPNVVPDSPGPPSVQSLDIGAGDVRLPAIPVGTHTGNHPGGNLAQVRGASDTGSHAGRLPLGETQPTSPTATAMQPSSAGNDAGRRGSAQSPISPLDTRLGPSSPLAQAHPEQEADPAPGAPADPLVSDPDDVGAAPGSLLAAGDHGGQTSVTAGGWHSAFAPMFGQRQVLDTAHAADGMIKALTAQGGLGASDRGLDLGQGSAGQIRLQGGATWSLSTLDHTMAALASAGSAADGQTNRVHALLINAMTSFAPMVSANSSPLLPPLPSDAYAMAAAVQLH